MAYYADILIVRFTVYAVKHIIFIMKYFISDEANRDFFPMFYDAQGLYGLRCRFYGAEVDDTEDKRLVQRLVDWLTRRGYTAHSLVLFQRLNPDYWYGWPEDIFWQHHDVDPFL